MVSSSPFLLYTICEYRLTLLFVRRASAGPTKVRTGKWRLAPFHLHRCRAPGRRHQHQEERHSYASHASASQSSSLCSLIFSLTALLTCRFSVSSFFCGDGQNTSNVR